MAAISQTIFSDAFSEWSFVFWTKFVPKSSIDNNPAFDLDNGLAPNRRQAIIWTNTDPIHWRIYVALVGGWVNLLHFVHLTYPLKSEIIETTPMWYHSDDANNNDNKDNNEYDNDNKHKHNHNNHKLPHLELLETWWRHQMETFSALLAICAGNSPAPGEFPPQRPVTRSFDVFFDLRSHKRLSKQWRGWWFETQSCPLWRHRNDWSPHCAWQFLDFCVCFTRFLCQSIK